MKKFSVTDVSCVARTALVIFLLTFAIPAIAEQKKIADPDRDPASELNQSSIHRFEHARMIPAPAVRATRELAGEGIRAAIDPETGELRQPTAEELRVLDLQMPMSSLITSSQPQQFQFADGTVMMMVPAELLNYSFASVSDEGVTVHCLDGSDHDEPSTSLTSETGKEE